MNSRTCDKCFRTKPLEDFAKGIRCVLGRRKTCKRCRAIYCANWKIRTGYIRPDVYRQVGLRWKVLVRDNFTC